jgi:hypothetical protein
MTTTGENWMTLDNLQQMLCSFLAPNAFTEEVDVNTRPKGSLWSVRVFSPALVLRQLGTV